MMLIASLPFFTSAGCEPIGKLCDLFSESWTARKHLQGPEKGTPIHVRRKEAGKVKTFAPFWIWVCYGKQRSKANAAILLKRFQYGSQLDISERENRAIRCGE